MIVNVIQFIAAKNTSMKNQQIFQAVRKIQNSTLSNGKPRSSKTIIEWETTVIFLTWFAKILEGMQILHENTSPYH